MRSPPPWQRAHPLVLDVTDFAAIPATVSQAESLAGPIDVLVNNASYGHEGVLEESSAEDLQRQFAANVYGPVAMMQAVPPGTRERRSGHIINVTFGSWLRTIRPGIPPSELVVANALRHSMPDFLLNSASGNSFAKFVIERQDTDKMEAFRLAS